MRYHTTARKTSIVVYINGNTLMERSIPIECNQSRDWFVVSAIFEGPTMASPVEKCTATASDTNRKFSPTEFTSHLDSKQKERYISKLNVLNISDPYCVPQALFTPLISSEILPDLQYPDIYNYLIEFPSMFTGASLKAYSFRFQSQRKSPRE